MVIMCTTLSVIICRLMCIWGPLMPIRDRLVRSTEDLAYSKVYITLEIILNIVFVLLSAVLLVCFGPENPNVPVRVWVTGSVVRYLIHLIVVWFEYRRVARRRELELQGAIENAGFISSALTSFAYSCDFFNMSVPFLRLNNGLYWVKSEDKLLQHYAPWLYWWLTSAYLAYDVTFAMIWLAGIIACCCLPSFIVLQRYGVRWTVADEEVSSEADVNVLPKYRFHMSRNLEKPSVGAGMMVPMDTSNGDSPAERVVLREDSECCICLCSYEDGIELHVLPCNHNFHVTCIEKWLKINAKCPVCNYSILKWSV